MNDVKMECTVNSARAMHELRGAVCAVMGALKQYRTYPIACVTVWIDPAILLRQVCVLYDEAGVKPVAYATWAYLAPDVEQRWLNDPQVLLDVREWNEEGRLWILDFAATPGYCRALVAYLKRHALRAHDEAFFVRRDGRRPVPGPRRWQRRGFTLA